MYAYSPETEDSPESEVKIGSIRLLTDLIISKWADESLYFQHFRLKRDKKYWSKALKALAEDPVFDRSDTANHWGSDVPDGWPKDNDLAKELYEDTVSAHGCPFAWLLGM